MDFNDEVSQENVFDFPPWWECTWRRKGCGQSTCPMCGQHKLGLAKELQNIFRTEEEREHGVSIDMFTERAEESIIEESDDLEDLTPEPEDFPLYQKVYAWHKKLITAAQKLEQDNPAVRDHKQWEDLLWYGTLLQGKVYRQLCSRFEMDNGNQFRDMDYIYTGYVLRESIKIIEESLMVMLPVIPKQRDFAVLKYSLGQLKPAILKI